MRNSSTKSGTPIKKPQGKFDFSMGLFLSKLLKSLAFWRRDRDSNPRWATNPCRFSRTPSGNCSLYKSIGYTPKNGVFVSKTPSNTHIINQVCSKGVTVLLSLVLVSACAHKQVKPLVLTVQSPVKVNFQLLENSQAVEVEYRKINKIKDASSKKFESLRYSGRPALASKETQREGFHYYFDGECFIVLVKPKKNLNHFENVLGHEMTHCFYGQFH